MRSSATAALWVGWACVFAQTYSQNPRSPSQAARVVTEEQKANVARGHLERGDAHVFAGAFHNAISQYEQSEAMKPNPDACLHKGAVLQALRSPEAALAHYANCEATHGASYALHYARGVAFWSLSDVQSAMDALRNASLLNGQIAVCQYQLGLMQHEVRLSLRLLPLAERGFGSGARISCRAGSWRLTSAIRHVAGSSDRRCRHSIGIVCRREGNRSVGEFGPRAVRAQTLAVCTESCRKGGTRAVVLLAVTARC